MSRFSFRGLAVTAVAFLSLAGSADAQLNLPRPSPKASVMQTVGTTEVSIIYSRPSVRERAIWGGLVPFDKVWRTGANEPTVITFADDVTVNGQPLAKGSYSIHTIPRSDRWTVIFNRSADPTGFYSYDEKQDVLRLDVTPTAMPNSELLTFSFPRVTSDGTADLLLQWEKVGVQLTIDTNATARALENARKAVADARRDAWRTPFRAADFAFQSGQVTPEAMTWIDQSLAAEENVNNLALKARMLAHMKNFREAIAVGNRAIAAAAKAANPPDMTALRNEIKTWESSAR